MKLHDKAFAPGVMGCWVLLLVGPLSYFLFQLVLHNWCNKGHMSYPASGMVQIKDPLLLIRKSSPCSGGSGFPFLLSEWSFTIMSDAK